MAKKTNRRPVKKPVEQITETDKAYNVSNGGFVAQKKPELSDRMKQIAAIKKARGE